MGDSTTVSRNFDLGFMSDISRDQLPRGAAYRMSDYIPQDGAPLRGRGGWTYASRDLNVVSATNRVEALGWFPYFIEGHLMAIGETGKVYKMKQYDGTNVANCGILISGSTPTNPTWKPFFHRDRMIITDSLMAQAGGTNTTPLKYYDSGGNTMAIATLGGTPPKFTNGASWGDYLIGSNGFIGATRFSNRVWWSDVGNPEAWTPTTSYWDMPEEIIGIVAKGNILTFFGYNAVHQLIGSVPPPGGDLVLKKGVFDQGCMDGRTICSSGDYIYWANTQGVFRTDGATITDLTAKGGISNYWRDLVSAFNFFSGYRCAAGIVRNHLFISYADISSTWTTLVCDLSRNVWYQHSNMGSQAYATRPAGQGTINAGGFEEMFFAPNSGVSNLAKRVANTVPIWTKTSANASDADGTAVRPSVETPFYKLGVSSLKRFRRLWVNYVLASASGSPTMDVGFCDGPEDTSYTALGSLPERLTFDRGAPLRIGRKLFGIGFQIKPSAASDDTRLYEVDLEGHAYEGSR